MLSVSEVQKFIDNDIVSEKKKFAGVGQRYYEGEHDIRKYRLFYYNADGKLIEDKVRSNVKISHPFFSGYLFRCFRSIQVVFKTE